MLINFQSLSLPSVILYRGLVFTMFIVFLLLKIDNPKNMQYDVMQIKTWVCLSLYQQSSQRNCE